MHKDRTHNCIKLSRVEQLLAQHPRKETDLPVTLPLNAWYFSKCTSPDVYRLLSTISRGGQLYATYLIKRRS